jgi:sigma-E factor negative regulatory protein RseB
MRSRWSSGRERLGLLVLACTLATAVRAEAPAHWLLKMNRALTAGNYEGTFSHWQRGRVEMLRILHRVQDGAVSERLVSLDGSGREFIRSGNQLACYLPDQHTVLVKRRDPAQPLIGIPQITDQTASFYDIQELARTRINRHDTHLITVTPRDDFRYGYRLWIDDATAMPLKTQLCDSHGHIMEQIVFASLTSGARIPDAAFRPEVATEGFQWLRGDDADAAHKEPLPQEVAASPGLKLPPGFRMTAHSAQTLPGLAAPVDHMVFTDGLASVSVFVEVYANGPPAGEVIESARVGSSSAFSVLMAGRKITAVGEVPPATVRFIANSVRFQGELAGQQQAAAPAVRPGEAATQQTVAPATPR